MKSFLLAISFLTIIPVKIKNFNQTDFKNSLKFFPIVGLILGIIFYGISLLKLDFELKSIIILFLWIILSGGFHLDGVADVFDAIGSVKDREKSFKIMKDSRIGAIGVIALITLILSKFVLIKHIILLNSIFIILPSVAGRYSINFLSWKLQYAKQDGLGKSIVELTDLKILVTSSIFTFIIFGLINLKLIFLFFDLLFFLYFISLFFEKKFGGITGDMLGCSAELTELFILFGGCLFVS